MRCHFNKLFIKLVPIFFYSPVVIIFLNSSIIVGSYMSCHFIYMRLGKCFIKVYIGMTTSVIFFLSHGLLAFTDPPLDTFSAGFSCVTAKVILDKCNI